jgi:hypothetical protein
MFVENSRIMIKAYTLFTFSVIFNDLIFYLNDGIGYDNHIDNQEVINFSSC